MYLLANLPFPCHQKYICPWVRKKSCQVPSEREWTSSPIVSQYFVRLLSMYKPRHTPTTPSFLDDSIWIRQIQTKSLLVPVCPQTRQRQHPYQLKSANYPSIPALTSFSIFSLSDTPIHRHTIYTIFMQVVLLFSRLSYLKANARIYSIIINHGIQLSVGTQRNIKIPKPDNYLRTCVGIFCIHMHICVHMIYTEWYIMSLR